MEVHNAVCDDEVLLMQENGHTRVSTRTGAILCAAAMASVAILGGRAVFVSSHVEDLTSLHESPWYAAWTSKPQRFDADRCTWDGDDCRASRCCAKPGSRCFVKNHHWASCNETCYSHMKWEGRVDRRGYWRVTNHHVWDCADITVSRATVAPTQAPPPVIVEVPAPAPPPTSHPSAWSIYERSDDFKTSRYSDDASRGSSLPVASTKAPVTWQQIA